MKKKMLALILSLTLCVSLLPAALAQGEAGKTFSDVPAGSWFESGVKLCAEKGIMIGIGDGTFAPNKALTAAECLTLALRLYDLQRGGDGVLEQLPDSWDDVTVTTADGSCVSGKLHDTFVYHYGSAKFNTAPGLQLRLTPDQVEWAKAQDSKDASITLLGKTYPAWATFAGSDDGASSILFFYSPELSGSNNVLAQLDSCLQHRGWWTNSLGHAFRLGLVDHDAHYGFWDLAESTGPVTADMGTARFVFALALAEAAGDLPALKKWETIPDLERYFWSVDNSGTYMLYEAGVLTGKDESGNFDPLGTLTRAEAAVMVARVLDPTLRIGAGNNMTTAEVEVEANRNLDKPFTSYAAAVENLRSGMGYSNERTFDTDTCTIFCYDLGGFMNAPLDYLRVVYKAGGTYPEGTILDLPFTTDRGRHVNTRTGSMALSGDGKTFTYTYTFEEIGSYGNPVQAGGTYTYVFDIPSGTVTLTQPVLRTVTYAQALEQVTQEEGHTVERIIEGAGVTAVLRYSLLEGRNNAKSYGIYLVYNSGGLKKEGTVDIEPLPSTAADGFYADRAPDHMFFSKDSHSFFYTYYTSHDASPYTSILDLEQGYHSSGHLPTVVELLSNRATVDKRVDGPAASALLVYDEHDGAKDYILYLINKETGGAWPTLLPSTYVGAAGDGGVYCPTDRAPDSISFSADGSILTYVYKFAQALKMDGTVYHEAGTYTYQVNVTTGELSVAHT